MVAIYFSFMIFLFLFDFWVSEYVNVFFSYFDLYVMWWVGFGVKVKVS